MVSPKSKALNYPRNFFQTRRNAIASAVAIAHPLPRNPFGGGDIAGPPWGSPTAAGPVVVVGRFFFEAEGTLFSGEGGPTSQQARNHAIFFPLILPIGLHNQWRGKDGASLFPASSIVPPHKSLDPPPVGGGVFKKGSAGGRPPRPPVRGCPRPTVPEPVPGSLP